jgi:hypothetical protein
MVQYIYRAYIYTQPDGVVGVTPSVENANKTDFENNFKSSALEFSDVDIVETSLIKDLSYTDFKAKIDGTTITWGDVRYEVYPIKYELFVISNNPI